MNRLPLVFAFLCLTLTSCKKSFTCKCVQTTITTAYTQYGVFHPQSTTASTFQNYYEAKKDEGASICTNWESISIDNYGSGESFRTVTTTLDCDI